VDVSDGVTRRYAYGAAGLRTQPRQTDDLRWQQWRTSAGQEDTVASFSTVAKRQHPNSDQIVEFLRLRTHY